MKNQVSAEQVKQLASSIPGDYAEQLASLKQLIAHGNLKSLDDEGRLKYYAAVCDAAGLNPLTQPFEFIEYKNVLKMYPTKQCAEQLRKIHGIGCEKVEHKIENDLYYVTVTIKDKTGRPDIATGIMPLGSKKGEDLANLIMKTETKAKRRATLSICGLGFLMDMDEDEAREKTISQQVKPQEYKLLLETEEIETANPEQVAIIFDLSEKLQKGDGYVEKVIKVKMGHEDLTKIPKKFADEWQANLQKRFDETEQFVKEMDGEAA
jgi:hypothetical protein